MPNGFTKSSEPARFKVGGIEFKKLKDEWFLCIFCRHTDHDIDKDDDQAELVAGYMPSDKKKAKHVVCSAGHKVYPDKRKHRKRLHVINDIGV